MTQNKATVAFPEPLKEYKQFTSDESNPMEPPQPPEGSFKVFNKTQENENDITLEDQETPLLFDPNEPPLMELKKINHRILFTFQKLFGILAVGNENPEPCLEEMKALFINAHMLLHKLRKVQAYEHFHHCLREQKRQLDEFKEKFDKKLLKAAQIKFPQ